MSDLTNSRMISASGMAAQAARLRLVSENIANVDTPGFRAKSVSFQAVSDFMDNAGSVRTGRVELSAAKLPDIYDPGHPLADENGYYKGANVDLMVQIADAREAQRSYEANLKMFDQSRQMKSSILELLKR